MGISKEECGGLDLLVTLLRMPDRSKLKNFDFSKIRRNQKRKRDETQLKIKCTFTFDTRTERSFQKVENIGKYDLIH